MRIGWRAGWGLAAVLGIGMVAGCGSGTGVVAKTPVTPAVYSGPHGEAMGGQQPVVNMTLRLYAAGTSGYGSAATDVFAHEGLTLPTTTSTGSFSFPAGWSCINGSDQVYLVGTGGQPFAANNGGQTNPNLGLMVALGTCSNLNAGTHIHMNELTTVGAVWALAPFMTGNTNSYQTVGTSATNTVGLGLAFNAAAQVVSTSTGTVPGVLPAGASVPTTEINSLADVLEACMNSAGGSENDGSACGTLFKDAPSAGGAFPTDTITAAMNIAQNPAQNVGPLFGIITPSPAFQPALGAAPNAWTVAIQYTGGGLNAPTTIAADQSGHIWVGNSGNTNVVSEFDNLGNPNPLQLTGTPLGGTPGGVAVDLSGNAWVTANNNELYELTALTNLTTGGSVANTYTPAGQLNLPTSIAIDPSNNVWVVNTGTTGNAANSVSAFTSAGVPLTGSPFTGAGISGPAGIAINGNANANCADCH
jgi:hypothetical protein